ncbi:hypothetical protein VQ01_09850 [Tamlana sp. s12]|nr:hypothetical protein VQ01_09850 [Tamlana sp. s12]
MRISTLILQRKPLILKNITSLSQTFLLLIVLLYHIQGHAKKAAYYNISHTKEQSVLTLNDIPQGSSVVILNDKKQVIFKKHHWNIKSVDLQFLNDGRYTFKIINAENIMRIPVIISSGIAFINNKEALISLKQFQSFCHIKNIYEHRSQITLYTEPKKHKIDLYKSY